MPRRWLLLHETFMKLSCKKVSFYLPYMYHFITEDNNQILLLKLTLFLIIKFTSSILDYLEKLKGTYNAIN